MKMNRYFSSLRSRFWKKTVLLAVLVTSLLSVFTTRDAVYARVSLIPRSGIYYLAWFEEGNIKIAIANSSGEAFAGKLALGVYRMGVQEASSTSFTIAEGTIQFFEAVPKRLTVAGEGRVSDTVFIYSDEGQMVGMSYVQNLHRSVSYFSADSYVVRAGDVVRLDIDLPRAGLGETVTLVLPREYEVEGKHGEFTVMPVLGEVHISEDDSSVRFSYEWQGVSLTTKTPRLSGVAVLRPRVEQIIRASTRDESIGLTPPEVLIIGSDIDWADTVVYLE